MLKLMGIFIIACGIAGAVGAWCDNYRRKIENIKAMIELLNRAVYVLVKEKRKVIYFFNIMSDGKTEIAAICGDMAKVLESRICATGDEAWKRCVSERKNELCMDNGINVSCGRSVFCKNRITNESGFEDYKRTV